MSIINPFGDDSINFELVSGVGSVGRAGDPPVMPNVSKGQFPATAASQLAAFTRDFVDVSRVANRYIQTLAYTGGTSAQRMAEQATRHAC